MAEVRYSANDNSLHNYCKVSIGYQLNEIQKSVLSFDIKFEMFLDLQLLQHPAEGEQMASLLAIWLAVILVRS